MARANAAYYANHDPFRDFTTAPEISQVFGEVLGLWAAVTWRAMGEPDPVILAEAGPGRGTLMADALRAIGQAAPAFGRALRLHLVELSPRLRAVQAAKLPGATWHARIDHLPPGPLLLLANEFLDALPIRQFVRRGDVWMERYVRDGAFVEVPYLPLPSRQGAGGRGGAAPPPEPGPPLPNPLPPGEAAFAEDAVIAVGEAARAIVSHLAARIAAAGGAALFLDYGPEASGIGDSLQALRDGKPADPLEKPGGADLTAHVDFAALANTARAAGAAAHGPVPQGLFLARLGLHQRGGALARRHPSRAAEVAAATRRLTEPDQMGRLFKALAICHPALPLPAGFAA